MRFRLRSPQQAAGGAHRVHGRPIAPPFPDGLSVIHLGMGCFWAGERHFWDLPGVWTTAVGFTPDHTEVVRVVFDPSTVSVEALLEVFLAGHDPTVPQGTLYRSVIGTDDPAVATVAREVIAREAERRGRPVLTAVVDGAFAYAAADQQQYLA